MIKKLDDLGILCDSSMEELMSYISKWTAVSIDTEGTGDINNIFSMKVTMLQLGDDRIQFIVDTRSIDPTPILKELIARNILLIGHNLKYDYSVIKLNYDLEIENVFDTMLACQLVEYDDKALNFKKAKKKKRFTLEAAVGRHVSPHYYSNQTSLFAPVVTKKIRESFAKAEGEFSFEQQYYGAYDVLTCFLLYKKLLVLLEERDLMQAIHQENEFLKVAADCEINGMPLDTVKWMDASANARTQTVSMLKELKAFREINWDSPKQVNEVLKSIGVDTLILDKKTGEIKESVGKIHLKKQESQFPILSLYINYKIEGKKCNAYGEKFLRHVNPQSGRIHTSLLQLKDTGRTGSSGPNMQNIPRDKTYRSAFHTGDENSFVIADFSNQEMRILGAFSEDVNLLKAFQNGSDIHLETAKITFNDQTLTDKSVERQWAKSINFLIAYGGGAKKLSETFGVPLAQAKQVLKTYMEAFYGLNPYFKQVGANARENGYVYINDVVGRRAPLNNYDIWVWLKNTISRQKSSGWDVHPKYKDAFSYLDSQIQRTAQNYTIQGSAADVSKWAGIYLRQYSKKIPFKILLLIHDEWVLECPDELTFTTSHILEKCCKMAVEKFISIPIPAKAVVTKHWSH